MSTVTVIEMVRWRVTEASVAVKRARVHCAWRRSAVRHRREHTGHRSWKATAAAHHVFLHAHQVIALLEEYLTLLHERRDTLIALIHTANPRVDRVQTYHYSLHFHRHRSHARWHARFHRRRCSSCRWST
jgi:hypothetical protein